MISFNTIGTAISLISGFLTLVSGAVAILLKRKFQKDSRDAELREKLIAATEWIFQTRYAAAQHRFADQLPELPQILQLSYVKAKAEEETKDGPYSKLLSQIDGFAKKMEDQGDQK